MNARCGARATIGRQETTNGGVFFSVRLQTKSLTSWMHLLLLLTCPKHLIILDKVFQIHLLYAMLAQELAMLEKLLDRIKEWKGSGGLKWCVIVRDIAMAK